MSLLGKVRKLVSQDRIRFQEGGFDLDLCYVTKNIVAMSMPSTGMNAMWRNNIEDIKRLLESRHPSCYLIFNLSEEKYDYDVFDNQILEFPFPDHHAPPFEFLFAIVNAVDSWIQASSDNVAFVHCKGGKGRTGVVIVCWLMYSALYPAISDAAKHFAAKRSSTEKGVTQPSQVRYLTYYSNTLLIGHEFPRRRYNIVSFFFGPLPKQFCSNFSVQILAYHGLTSDELFSADDTSAQVMNDNYFQMKVGIPVVDDVLIRFYNTHTHKSTPKKLFHIVFHTSFLNARDHDICFLKRDLDNPSKKIPSTFSFSCEMQRLPDAPGDADPKPDSPIMKMCQTFQQRVRRKNASLGSHRGHFEITTQEEKRRMQMKREERRDEFAAQAKSTASTSTPTTDSGASHWNFTVPGASHGESLTNETSNMLSHILDDSAEDPTSTTSALDLSSPSPVESSAIPVPGAQRSTLSTSDSLLLSSSLPAPPSCLPPQALTAPVSCSPSSGQQSLSRPPLATSFTFGKGDLIRSADDQELSSAVFFVHKKPIANPNATVVCHQHSPTVLSSSPSPTPGGSTWRPADGSQLSSSRMFQADRQLGQARSYGFLSNQRSRSMTQLPPYSNPPTPLTPLAPLSSQQVPKQ